VNPRLGSWAFVAVFFLGASAHAADSWIGYTPEQLAPEIKSLFDNEPSYTKRLLAISQHFLGAPYLFSPLGEATGEDNDPLFTTKQFDCLSLVEISMALASTPEIEEAMSRLKQLRYTGDRVHFSERKHFMESQWIPDNTQGGWLQDVTKQVGGGLTVRVHKQMSPAIYAKRKKLAELDLPVDHIPNGTFAWNAIPLDKVMQVADKIPTGTLLFVVRQDFATTPYRITHVGIVMQKKAGTYLRHAKDQGAHRVLDMPLEAVVKRHSEFSRWPVTGISLYFPQQPTPRKVANKL
jgi:Protein of unknown function (DUF1460)